MNKMRSEDGKLACVIIVLLLFAMILPGCVFDDKEDSGAKIKAFGADFNWGAGGPNKFAAPGLFSDADVKTHIDWHVELGANVIQNYCVSCNGYAWYRSEIVPMQPGLETDFLSELTEMAHGRGLLVMGYFCISANTRWGQEHPELNYGIPNRPHIPFTSEYLEYLSKVIPEALEKTGIDGFMIDWVFNFEYKPGARSKWLACEREMYAELFGEPFPGIKNMSEELEIEFHRRAVGRCWETIKKAAKSTKPDCVIWLTCPNLKHPTIAGQTMLKEVDWLMNESPDIDKIRYAQSVTGPETKIIQCVAGWGDKHDTEKILRELSGEDIDFYGFGRVDPVTTLPPEESDDPLMSGNARNIKILRKFYRTGVIAKP